MPLPEGGNIPWPPNECTNINKQISTWAAWYSGDMNQLAAAYGGANGDQVAGEFFGNDNGVGWRATANKIVDTIRRWFWGNRSTGSRPRNRLHVPIASDIAAASADLLFSEPPRVSVPVDEKTGKPVDETTQTRLDELMDDGMHATLLESAEICAALGGVYLRIVWDKDTRDCPWIAAVQPDAAVPSWKWGQLSQVIFWKIIREDGKTVVRHLECHEPGKIVHGVYQGERETLGTPVSLADYPETRALAELLVDGNEIVTGAKKLTAVYIPNMRPNRIWRNNPHAVHLGRSDYAGVEPLMDALDMVYSSWMRDVELGKARLIVPAEYMKSNGQGQGATLDLDQEVYEKVNAMSSDAGGVEIKEVQFAIRVTEHQETCTDLKSQIVTTAGYSAQTFGLGNDGQAVTATEIAAKNRRSIITRDRKSRYYTPPLGDIYESWLEVDAFIFSSGVTPVRPAIDWPAAVSVDPEALAREAELWHRAEAISTEEKVKLRRPDWPQEKVDAEVEKIKPKVEDPGLELGPPGGKPPFGAGEVDETDEE